MTTTGSPITLRSPLTLRNAFVFPVQSRAARVDLLIGGLLLLIPVIGFIFNMGYRLHVVHDLQRDRIPWPRWRDAGALFRHGSVATAAIVAYHAPAWALAGIGWWFASVPLLALGLALWVLTTFTVPGFMTFYAVEFDQREV